MRNSWVMVRFFSEVKVFDKCMLEKMKHTETKKHGKDGILRIACQMKTFRNKIEKDKRKKKSGAQGKQRPFPIMRKTLCSKRQHAAADLRTRCNNTEDDAEKHVGN